MKKLIKKLFKLDSEQNAQTKNASVKSRKVQRKKRTVKAQKSQLKDADEEPESLTKKLKHSPENLTVKPTASKRTKQSNELNKRLNFRVTEEEFDAFTFKVKQNHLSNSQALRVLVKKYIAKNTQSLLMVNDAEKRSSDLSRLANNLNQSVKALHILNKIHRGDVTKTITKAENVLKQLNEYFNQVNRS